MGRLIDCNDVYNAIQITTDNFGVAKKVVEDNMLTMLSKIETVEAIPKAEYENRLKADMVAMLEELHKEIMKMSTIDICPYAIDNCIDRIDVEILVREKINKLKGETK